MKFHPDGDGKTAITYCDYLAEAVYSVCRGVHDVVDILFVFAI